MSNNSIYTIFPCKIDGVWIFDDNNRGITAEPFVAGTDAILDTLAGGADRLVVLFSDRPFPDADLEAELNRQESGGAWYRVTAEGNPTFGESGWLCPTLTAYFPSPPRRLYVKVRPPAGDRGSKEDANVG